MKKVFIIAVLIVVLLVATFVFVMRKSPSSLAVQNEEESEKPEDIDWDWVKDNCNCIERERLFCGFEGFVLNEDGYCYKEKEFTNPLRGCSKYNCTGEIYVYEGE